MGRWDASASLPVSRAGSGDVQRHRQLRVEPRPLVRRARPPRGRRRGRRPARRGLRGRRPASRSAAAAVVGDVDLDRVDAGDDLHRRPRGLRVLRRVRERLGDEVVRAGLELGSKRERGTSRSTGSRPSRRSASVCKAGAEAVLGERGRMQPARDLAHLLDRERELLLGAQEQVARRPTPSGSRAIATRSACSETTRRCWAPSWRFRSSRRRSASRACTRRSWATRRSRSVWRNSVASRTIVTTSFSSIGTTRVSNSRSSPRIVGSTYSTVCSVPVSSARRIVAIRAVATSGGSSRVDGPADDVLAWVREQLGIACEVEVACRRQRSGT